MSFFFQINSVIMDKIFFNVYPINIHVHRRNWRHPMVAIFSMDQINLSCLGRGSSKEQLCKIIFKSAQLILTSFCIVLIMF